MVLWAHWSFSSYGSIIPQPSSFWGGRSLFCWRKRGVESMLEGKRRRTKIVCTIGPSSESPQTLETLIQAGMNVARLNFSHGTHEEHFEKIKTIRQIAERLNQPVAILQDLSGPKIRIGKVKEGGVELRRGENFFLTNREIMGDGKGVSVSYFSLPNEVKPGDTILLSDGTIDLQVLETNGQDI